MANQWRMSLVLNFWGLNITEDLTWASHTSTVIGRAQQRLVFPEEAEESLSATEPTGKLLQVHWGPSFQPAPLRAEPQTSSVTHTPWLPLIPIQNYSKLCHCAVMYKFCLHMAYLEQVLLLSAAFALSVLNIALYCSYWVLLFVCLKLFFCHLKCFYTSESAIWILSYCCLTLNMTWIWKQRKQMLPLMFISLKSFGDLFDLFSSLQGFQGFRLETTNLVVLSEILSAPTQHNFF